MARMGERDSTGVDLSCIAHESTHYFQWINDLKLTEIGVVILSNAKNLT